MIYIIEKKEKKQSITNTLLKNNDIIRIQI